MTDYTVQEMIESLNKLTIELAALKQSIKAAKKVTYAKLTVAKVVLNTGEFQEILNIEDIQPSESGLIITVSK